MFYTSTTGLCKNDILPYSKKFKKDVSYCEMQNFIIRTKKFLLKH